MHTPKGTPKKLLSMVRGQVRLQHLYQEAVAPHTAQAI
jgi:hypothetical protein